MRAGKCKFLIAFACLAVAASGGCSNSHHAAKHENSQQLVISVSKADLPETLPPTMCFVGLLDYDVTLLGEARPHSGLCDRLADRYFPGAAHLPWAPAKFEDADLVGECQLVRRGERIIVSRGDPDFEGPRFDRAYDAAERVCAALHAEGWRAAPKD